MASIKKNKQLKSYGSAAAEEQLLLLPLSGVTNNSNGSSSSSSGIREVSWKSRAAAVVIFCVCILFLRFVSSPFFNSSSRKTDILIFHSHGPPPPFPITTRGEEGREEEALWNILDKDLISNNLLGPITSNNNNNNNVLDTLGKPFPTGAFWTNLVLRSNSREPIVSEPYAFQWTEQEGLQLSYPAYRRSIQPNSIQDYFYPDLTLSSSTIGTKRNIQSYDTTSVTLRFYGTTESSYLETYVVEGSPYITTKFVHMAPKLTALTSFAKVECLSDSAEKHGLCSKTFLLEEKEDNATVIIYGVQFVLEQQEGQRWLLFASEPITFQLLTETSGPNHNNNMYLEAMETNYQGVLRLAYIPTDAGETLIQRLMAHSRIYPISGRVLTDYNIYPLDEKEIATITFNYETAILGNTNTNDMLLMLILPHHVEAIRNSFSSDTSTTLLSNLQFAGTYTCIKGNMTAVIGNSWSYKEILSTITLDNDRLITSSSVIRILPKHLVNDVSIVLPTATDIYGFGKEIARMAQLAHIAHVVGNSASHKTAIRILHDALVYHLFETNQSSNHNKLQLVYDTDLGGILSLSGLEDSNADFGNGRYNDHHFHYGYIIYACTILGRYNSTFLHTYKHHVDSLVLDVGNPLAIETSSSNTPYSLYPVARHKSFYGGHSWASGLFPQANGKSQESSSEAVNCYFAMTLWAQLKEDGPLHNFSRLLLAMELRSAKTYWHMDSTSPFAKLTPFSTDNFMVGNLGGLDVTSSTWFGNKAVYVHMINMLPITSITEELFNEGFVKSGQYASIARSNKNNDVDTVEMAWRGFLVCNHAILDPTAAWLEATTKLISYELDASLSLSQVLYWIATRPNTSHLEDIILQTNSSDASCKGNPSCAKLGLEGNCCPSDNKIYLGCCY